MKAIHQKLIMPHLHGNQTGRTLGEQIKAQQQLQYLVSGLERQQLWKKIQKLKIMIRKMKTKKKSMKLKLKQKMKLKIKFNN